MRLRRSGQKYIARFPRTDLNTSRNTSRGGVLSTEVHVSARACARVCVHHGRIYPLSCDRHAGGGESREVLAELAENHTSPAGTHTHQNALQKQACRPNVVPTRCGGKQRGKDPCSPTNGRDCKQDSGSADYLRTRFYPRKVGPRIAAGDFVKPTGRAVK